MFHVVHRERDPFVVETGGVKIVDLGTAFNVVRRDRQTSVAVSEGIVLYNPERDNVRLVAGKGIEARDGDRDPPVVRDVDVANVGGRSEEHTSELQSLMRSPYAAFCL